MAATTVLSDQICQFVETQLMHAEGQNPENIGWSFNALRCITEASNATTDINFSPVLDMYGKCPNKVMQVRYDIPECDRVAADCVPDFFACSTGTAEAPTCDYDQVDVTGCAQETYTFNTEQYRCDCKDPQMEFIKGLKKRVHSLARKKFRYLIEKIAMGAGSAYNGIDPTSAAPLPLNILDASGKPNAAALFHVRNEYMKQTNSTAEKVYAITGSDKMAAFDYLSGLDYNGAGVPTRANDRFVETCYDYKVHETLVDLGLVNEGVLTFTAGAFKLLEYNEFMNDKVSQTAGGRFQYLDIDVYSNPLVFKQVIDFGSVFLGFPLLVDVEGVHSDCKNEVTLNMQICYDLYKRPQAAWCGTYNNCLLWDLLCQDTVCEDFCSDYVAAP